MLLFIIEHILLGLLLTVLISIYVNKGKAELYRVVVVGLKALPGVEGLIQSYLHKEATGFIKQIKLGDSEGKPPRVSLPKEGISHDELRHQLAGLKEKEVDHSEGKVFAYVYTLDDSHYNLQADIFDQFEESVGYSVEHDALVQEFQQAFLHENALNPVVFPSLRKMETEIVSMTAAMLNGSEDAVGSLTTGGTESILMAVKTFRDRARKLFPHITHPEIVCPITQHPAIDKAGHYFGVKIIHTPVDSEFKADLNALKNAITPNTILLAASAPQYCHGIIDPIEEISDIAVKRGLPLHIDACFGGFMLPWLEKLEYPGIPKWDFRCAGVMSISADIHKYGYGVKGSSVIVYRNSDLRKYQIYTYSEWPGGLYGSPSMAGTRPGGNIAASWASMKALGESGYMKKAKELMDITETLKNGIRKIDGLCIVGQPKMTAFAIGSADPDMDILAVCDVMETRGWTMERQQNPTCIHCSILPHHRNSMGTLLDDLAFSVKEAKANTSLSKKGTAGMYGMMAMVPDKAIINEFIAEFFSEIYKIQ
ncbi:sphingosine-1-phosphate lyase-like [Gigantopelta aegis]|uniref:sphingosine-1-phosphate lyase-like n=1 Tax=Gigantopelta aegis TaxID=1735272 RepID=UPI001B88A32C|nr:sphingosine-1-phosphate lyase-like [Gigantopelta aegis]